MSNYQHPPIAPYFLAQSWDTREHGDLRDQLQKAIVQDPEIASKADISVDLKSEGAKVSEIRLVGSAGSNAEKERAEQIVSVNTKNEVKILNELVVK